MPTPIPPPHKAAYGPAALSQEATGQPGTSHHGDWGRGSGLDSWTVIPQTLEAKGAPCSGRRRLETFSLLHSSSNIYCTLSTRHTIVKKSQCLPLGEMSELGLGVDVGQGGGWGEGGTGAVGPAPMHLSEYLCPYVKRRHSLSPPWTKGMVEGRNGLRVLANLWMHVLVLVCRGL